jgi:hypothetical protein
MIVLNNNDLKEKNAISSTEIFSLPNKKQQEFKSIWSFKFNFDTITNGRSMKLGGNKILENGNILINEGVVNRIVEVSKNKEFLWDLRIFKRESSGIWSHFAQYRVDFSTSLYPYYFSCGIDKQSAQNTNLVIFNEGDYSDSYLYDIMDEHNNILISNSTTTIVKQSKDIVIITLNINSVKKIKIQSQKSGLIKEILLN